MGVPKFFRYISERYPCLSELITENQIPEFDNLYLDMNAIIHVCSHPNDSDPHFRISEENIFKDIAHYIEVLFRMIQPQKLFFMAVDGVAPRAKMNQQRGRRFRSAKEAQDLEDAAKAKGETLPKEARFDSNCITPGTAFMARLQDYLKLFVRRKMNTDSNWQKCRVILSGHETPGEGEHKIMEYIRYLKAKPDYDSNTRHCLYGNDADLIMLGLCTHEPHFSLLREEVKFGKQANNRTTTPEETRFYLLHLSLMRDYLEQEFYSVKEFLTFPYDFESIIDDWIFMGFLVGNDFIPNIPNLHINQNALPLLYDVYKEVLPTLDGYINEQGRLNLNRLEKFIKKLADFDRAHFSDMNADLKYFAAKRSDDAWQPEHSKSGSENKFKSKELLDLVSAVDEMFLEDESPETECEDLMSFDLRDKNIMNMTDEEILEEEFNLYKRDYYINKLGYKAVNSDVLAEQSECYIRALQWALLYYYRGVCSWGWFYPHHYAPFISDISNFKNLDYSFSLGKPFLPFQQLLAVLPAASGALLPDPFRKLMVSMESPILQYYPTTFETDLNGKTQEWEAVVLIPFIEEELLLKAMSQQEHLLSPEEATRNTHGPMLQYDYIVTSSIPDLTADIPDPPKDFVQETTINRVDIYVPEDRMVLGPLPGAKFDVHFPGFPTLKHLKYKSRLEKGKVKVFDYMTRNDSVIIELEHDTAAVSSTWDVAERLLGKSVFVQWPHLVEAKVLCVMDDKFKYRTNDKNAIAKEAHTNVSRDDYEAFRRSSKKHYYERLGVDIGETRVMLEVLQLKNRVYVFGKHGRITLEKEWGSISSRHPLQTCVGDLKVHDSQFVQYDTVEEVFAKFKQVYLLSRPYYGCMGIVYDTENNGRLKIGVFTSEEPDFATARQMHVNNSNTYLSGYDAAAKLGIANYLLGRITGTIYVSPGSKDSGAPPPQDSFRKFNIGLNLKFTKKNEELTGYTRRIDNTWYYSLEAVELLRNYTLNFPEVFQAMNQGNSNDSYYESDLYPDEVGTGKLERLMEWLKKQPHNEALRKNCGSEALTKDVVQEVMRACKIPLKTSRVVIGIKPIHVFVPGLQPSGRAPDPHATFKLFERVVNVRPNHTVPLGAKGTIVGLHKVRDPNPTHQTVAEQLFLDVIFDEPFEGGTSYCGTAEKCYYRMTTTSVINLTFGSEPGGKKLLVLKNSQMNAENHPNVQCTNNTPLKNKSSNQGNAAVQNHSIAMNSPAMPSSQMQTPPRSLMIENTVKHDIQDNISPAERKQFWDDLLKQKTLSSPNVDTGTEALKQILGVPKTPETPQQKASFSLKPEKMYSFGVGCQNPITVQDMFNHARASTSAVAPNLPPPPMQWYGPPKATNNPKSALGGSPHIGFNVQSPITPKSQVLNKVLVPGLIPLIPPVPKSSNVPHNNLLRNPPVTDPSTSKMPGSHADNTPSAFIPLQAVKKGRIRNNSQTQIQDLERPPTKEELDEKKKLNIHQKRKEIQQKQVQNQQHFQKYLMTNQANERDENNLSAEKQTPKQKVRKSRIAANFGTPL